jgi:hypothetical protein
MRIPIEELIDILQALIGFVESKKVFRSEPRSPHGLLLTLHGEVMLNESSTSLILLGMNEIPDLYFFLQERHSALNPESGLPTIEDDEPHRSHLFLR